MKLYNTLARHNDLQDFTPLEPPHVGIYSCGPTVYDHIHIGNLSAFIAADTLRRVLTAEGYQVRHVMNFTDVDDKIITRSQQAYPGRDPKEALSLLTKTYSDIFVQDMRAVGNDIEAMEFQRATDPASIAAMQQLIQQLLDDGFAYLADDGIYFSIDAYRTSGKVYGQLSHITQPKKQHARIHNDEYDKDTANDFVLWKKHRANEPSWEFTVNGRDMAGRPGWHIECSAMSTQALGQPFDIHTGGIDLVFPHHENEIAQSTAGKRNPVYARYFVHNEHVLVDGKKMSKSLKNFYTLEDIRAQGFSPLAFRLLVLQSHYRSQTHFTWDNLAAAGSRLLKFQNFAARIYQVPSNIKDLTATQPQYDKLAPEFCAKLHNRLADDIDTPGALAVAEEFLTLVERVEHKAEVPLIKLFVQKMDELFGLQLGTIPDISSKAKKLVAQREAVRHQKDWPAADQLRSQLKKDFRLGINDADNQPTWYRLDII